MKKNVLLFLAFAALLAVALAILALFGACAEVGVVMTGSGPNVLLGAAWIACWLATLVVSPIALGAAALSFSAARWRSAPAAAVTRERFRP